MAKNKEEFEVLLVDLIKNQINPLVKTTTGELDLSEKGLEKNDIERLVLALKDNNTVTKLDLSDNGIDLDGLKTLIETLDDNNKINYIDLSVSNFGDEGAQFLGEKLLSKVMNNEEKLIGLKLYGNEIGAQGAKKIANAFFKSTKIEEINLSNNKNIGTEGLEVLGKLLINNKSLRKLSLFKTGITNENIHHLAKPLGLNTTLIDLDISANKKIGVEGIDKINEALKRNKNCKLKNLNTSFVYRKEIKKDEIDKVNERTAEACPLLSSIGGFKTPTNERKEWLNSVKDERPNRERHGKEPVGKRLSRP